MKTVALSVMALALVVIAIAQYTDAMHDNYRAAIDYTKTVCDASHNVTSGEKETECGRMQDETNTEYLCGQYNCWLEVK